MFLFFFSLTGFYVLSPMQEASRLTTIKTPSMISIHFAPLQGYTDAAFRRLHHELWGGITAYYTPFVRIEKGAFRRKDLADIAPAANAGVPVVPQMLPRDADELCRMADLFIENGYARADINMACPFPPVALHGRGAGLLPHPDAVEGILEATRRYPELSFSVKMRLGWDNADDCMRLAPLLNDYPLHHVTLHPRIGKMQYKGSPSIDDFEAFGGACRLPLIYNGDILSLGGIARMHELFPWLAGVMIGRGLLAAPQLASAYAAGETRLFTPSVVSRLQHFHDAIYNRLQATSQGESQLMVRLQALWQYFLPDAPRRGRKALLKTHDAAGYCRMAAMLFDAWREACGRQDAFCGSSVL